MTVAQEVELATVVPRPVRLAMWLQIAVAGIDVAALVVALVGLPAIVDDATAELDGQDLQGLDPAVFTAIGLGFAVGAILVAVAFDVLAIVFATKMARGRRWARIVLTVFAGLRLTELFGLASPWDPTELFTIAIAIGSIAAIVLAFRPIANAWFRAIRAAKAGW